MEGGGGSFAAGLLRRGSPLLTHGGLFLLVLWAAACTGDHPSFRDASSETDDEGVRVAALPDVSPETAVTDGASLDGSGVADGSGVTDGSGASGGSAVADGSGGSGATDGSSGTDGSAVEDGSGGSGVTDGSAVADDAPNGPEGLDGSEASLPDHPRFGRPDHVRGIYLNAWTAGSSRRVGELLDLARETEINTFVIDLKDASGYVSYDSDVPLAREIGATEDIRIRDLPGLLQRLQSEGIYPIARIVVVKDPVLVAARPDLAVQDTAGGVWVDDKGIRWLNPNSREVWDYHVDLAREAAGLGFPEIQWDYVRFPDAPPEEMDRAVFPGSSGEDKSLVIRSFLAYAREQLGELDTRMTADVFGITATARDVGIGQVWERFIDVVDVALPMVYPSHYYTGSFGFENPNAHPYEVVRHALEDALRRSASVEGAGAVRPWLQNFTLGEPPYGPPEVRAQIQAVYDAGLEEWLLWNPGSHYTLEALEPEGGFPAPPRIRVAGRVVSVGERFEALEVPEQDSTEVRPLSPSPAPGVPVESGGPAVEDTLVRPDTIPPP